MKSYLMHHGILGQKWGVRRYQNKDGSLTEAGKKHYEIAGNVLKKQAEKYRKDAEDFKDATASISKRYGGKDGHKKWLQDMYGDDWKDAKYMKDVFEVDDVEKHGKEGAREEIKDARAYNTQEYKTYMELADVFQKQAEKYINSKSINDFSKNDLKQAEKLVKQFMKDQKHMKKK